MIMFTAPRLIHNQTHKLNENKAMWLAPRVCRGHPDPYFFPNLVPAPDGIKLFGTANYSYRNATFCLFKNDIFPRLW